MTRGVISVTGAITRSSTCRNFSSSRAIFIRATAHLVATTDFLLRERALSNQALRSIARRPEKHSALRRGTRERIEHRVAELGADGKLLLDADGNVYQVNLLEKLLVPLLSKLANLVVDGGIWMNTQRPEWNDANNALVGQGLSMVTLYYLRRYVSFLQQLLADETEAYSLSNEVGQWLADTAAALRKLQPLLATHSISDSDRFESLRTWARRQVGIARPFINRSISRVLSINRSMRSWPC